MTDLLDRITLACSGGGDDAMIIFRSELGVEDPSAKVAPPTYPEGSKTQDGQSTRYVLEQRLVDGEPHEVAVLDSFQSQANRVEEALENERAAGRTALPGFMISSPLGDGRTVRIPSLKVPHRYADAYQMNCTLRGEPFDKSTVGKSLQLAQPEDVRALYEHSPESLVYGAWNSHRKGRQARFPRIYRSEVIGVDPQVGSRRAGRMDPENLAGQAKQNADGSWSFASSGEKVKGSKLSERGLGNIAPMEGPGGVTVSSIVRLGALSFAGVRRLGFGDLPAEAAVAARATLIALALYGDRLAFGQPSIWLRSGADLVVLTDEIAFLRRGGDKDKIDLDASAARDLFQEARTRATVLGVTMGEEQLDLVASPALQDAIKFAYLRADATEAS